MRGKINKKGLPLERKVVLFGLEVPQLGGPGKANEPFAFEAREFLRK